MNIFSEVVANKEFHSAIDSHILNLSQEYRVLATLRYLFPGKYEDMKPNDRPDLQDKVNNIGIEVTAAVSNEEMQVLREYSWLCTSNTNENIQKSIKKLEEFEYTVHPQTKALSSRAKGTGGEELVFKDRVKQKCDKITDYRKHFGVVGLAMLLAEMRTRETENNCINWTKEVFATQKAPFDFVYIIGGSFCIFYNTNEDTHTRHSLITEASRNLRKIARMTAEGQLTLESPEWN